MQAAPSDLLWKTIRGAQCRWQTRIDASTIADARREACQSTSCRFTHLHRSATVRMSEPHNSDGMPPEDGRTLLAEVDRRFEALLDMLLPELREEIDEGKISRHEASTFVLDCLLNDAAVWQDAQKLLAPKRPKATGPKLPGKADDMRRLAAAFDVYAEASPHAGRSVSSLVRNFRKTLGSEFGWLRGMSHERIEDLIREGRRLLVPDSECLANARRAILAADTQSPSPEEPQNTGPENELLAPSDSPNARPLPAGDLFLPALTAKEVSFLRLIKREK